MASLNGFGYVMRCDFRWLTEFRKSERGKKLFTHPLPTLGPSTPNVNASSSGYAFTKHFHHAIRHRLISVCWRGNLDHAIFAGGGVH